MIARMSCQAVNPHDNATVLHHSVWPKQLGTYRANPGSQRLCNHLPQPTCLNNLDIVVHQANQFTSGNARCSVVDGGVIERIGVRQHSDAARSELGKVSQGLWIAGLIINNDDFKIRIICFVQ